MASNLTKAKGKYRIRACIVSDRMEGRAFVGYGDAFVGERDAWKFKTRTEAEEAARNYKGVFVTLVFPT